MIRRLQNLLKVPWLRSTLTIATATALLLLSVQHTESSDNMGVADTWDESAVLPTAQAYPAVESYDGKIYVFGGDNDGSIVQIYDAENDSWSTGLKMPEARTRASAVELNGYIYIVGGHEGGPTDTIWRYDPENDSWKTDLENKPTTIRDNGIAATDGNLIYVPGGTYRGTAEFGRMEAYDPANDEWLTDFADLPQSQRQHTTAYVEKDNALYITGGESKNEDTDRHVRYDIENDVWEEKEPRPYSRACSRGMRGGKIYFRCRRPHSRRQLRRRCSAHSQVRL